MRRKILKKYGKSQLKKHYLIFVVACFLAALIGTDYFNPFSFFNNASDKLVTDAYDTLENLIIGDLIHSEDPSGNASYNQTKETINIGGLELGYARGVLASAIKTLSSGSIFLQIFNFIAAFGGKQSPSTIVLFVLSVLLSLLLWTFITNNYRVAYRRIFLEGQYYDKVAVDRFTFLIQVRKLVKPALSLLLMTVYQFLWSLTIIGGIIKMYSYFLVPYILAENPNTPPNKAITLSRKMMRGHKWECFILQMSFIGWNILGWLTFGLLEIFFVNPYRECTYCKYYEYLRVLAKKNGIEYSEFLNDDYLYNKASVNTINNKYKDVIELMNIPEKEIKQKNKFLTFLANVFGIVLLYNKDERVYSEQSERKLKIKSYKAIVEQQTYPHRLNPLYRKDKVQQVERLHYMRQYSISSLIMMFFIFSFAGWLWEVCLFLINTGTFVNRGVLHGPWLPIYGSGGIMILTLLNKLKSKPVLEFSVAVVICGIVEYCTALFLETMHDGQKWWDYSGYFLNFNGRISAEGLIVFGIAGMAVVYLIAPMLDNLLRKIRLRFCIPICVALILLFSADQIYSSTKPNVGEGITDNDRFNVSATNPDYQAENSAPTEI